MNKSMLTGLLAGVGIAVAGGVAGFSIMNSSSGDDDEMAEVLEAGSSDVTEAASAPAPAAPAPRAAAQPAAVAAAPEPAIECWDEEVVVQAEARDERRIAGTAAGALIGGALADRLGDDDDLVTAAGAAAGAYIGRRAQGEYQENRIETVIEQRCAPVQ